MAPEMALITDVCPYRAPHGALAVRHVHVTPAADARALGRWNRTATTRARRPTRGAGRAINTARRRRAVGGRMQRREAHAHARYTHTHARGIAIRWKRTNTHMRSQRHTYTHRHARTHTNEHKHTNEHTRKRTRSLHADAHAREDPAHPRYPLVPPSTP